MLPEDETFLRCYSLAGLYERLREDAALYPDTMDSATAPGPSSSFCSGWSTTAPSRGPVQHAQAPRRALRPRPLPIPRRPPVPAHRQIHERIEPPLVPDGTILHVLEKLLVLEGERISYRALDVEQIGSVYETMMGFGWSRRPGRRSRSSATRSTAPPPRSTLSSARRRSRQAREVDRRPRRPQADPEGRCGSQGRGDARRPARRARCR